MPFGEYLEHLRRSRSLQQKQVADIMGINPCYVSALEKGRRRAPSKQVITRIIEHLRLTQEEQTAVWYSVEIFEPQLRLPSTMSKAEFEFVHKLSHSLGNLSHSQLVIMGKTLDWGNQVRKLRQMNGKCL
ncbi:helix-turn-helix domain-containing protein [Cellvibrio sp. BR]|uniref:helix-turn-helix domain-containing protein n=1 Tax=Cellvibrio sp. BR TaxID=1134474 RepID=UPI00058F7BC9|nr:helix-turn-helix transcriptional regulator [Cellvibrio sp. BR]